MKKYTRIARTLLLVGILALLGASIGPAHAQSYSFAVPSLKMQVYVQPDASAKIIYDITFENYGSPIDIVDIGMPHRDYDLNNIRASINGVGLNKIYKSEYIDVGVEIHLGSQTIAPGNQGTLHVEFTMPDMVYQDTTRKDYASLQITPTWFDAGLVQGNSNIQIAIHMLEGIDPDEVLYQDVPFSNKALYQGRVVAIWQWSDKRATQAHRVGVSFPQRGMQQVVKMSLLDLINKWLKDHPETRFILGALATILFAMLFFRFSGGTGMTVFVLLAAAAVFIFVVSPISVLLAIPLVIVLIIVNEVNLSQRRKTYLPPIAQVEGGGIKRGLTAPEAAVLLEMPLNKILTLIMFGMLEKGLIRTVKESPLTVEVIEDFRTSGNPDLTTPKKRRSFRRHVAQQKGTVIHVYEDNFLNLLELRKGKAVKDIDFSKAIELLIKSTAAKMKGFDLSDTQAYYRRVINRAMQQAQSIGEIGEREKYLDKYLPWVMMDQNYPTVFTHRGYHYWPTWSRSRSTGRSFRSPAKSSGRRASPGGSTSMGDVAASFAGWTETTMGSLAGSILPSSMSLPNAKGGVIDLSGVDRVTGDVFEALSKASSSSGGGGGGSCACACAGCACACACAGGGR